jgi:hypothetical protein
MAALRCLRISNFSMNSKLSVAESSVPVLRGIYFTCQLRERAQECAQLAMEAGGCWMKCLDQLREAVEAVYSGAPRFEISLINCSALVRMRQVLGSDVDWLLHSMIVRGEVLRESEGESVGKLKKLLPLLKTGTPSGRDLTINH